MVDSVHEPYVMEEPPQHDEDLREFLSRELKRIENAFNGTDLEAESRWINEGIPGISVTKGNVPPDLAVFRDNIYLYGFGGTGSLVEECYFSVAVPHDIKPGTFPTFHIHWTHNIDSGTYTPDSATVKWQLEYTYANAYESASFIATATLATTQTAGAQYLHHITLDTDMPMPVVAKPEQQILCRLFRDPTDASDTFDHDAFLIQVNMHYERGNLGTTEKDGPFKEHE